MGRETFLGFRRNRYLKLASALALASTALYVWHRQTLFDAPGGLGYGGSSVGYLLGTMATVFVLWLMWLGVRKRSYASSRTTLQGWLSAHVYFGMVTVILALLHCGLEFGPNIHTLAFGLLLAVVASGIYGVVVLLKVPKDMTEAMGQDNVQTLVLQLQDMDAEALQLAVGMSDEVNALVLKATESTRLRGTVFDHLSRATSRRCPTRRAVKRLQSLVGAADQTESRLARQLLGLMVRRQTAVARIRQEYRSIARMRLWLMCHVPMSFALLVALFAHIASVFIYW